MTTRLKLGVLTRVYSPLPSPRVLDETLELIVAAESLGFDSAWIAQHHFGVESGRLPSPLVLLGAAARRTRTIELGTGVVVLPLESPLRLAEDAAVVDALSDGRLHLGVGSGFDPQVFAAFGEHIEDRRTRLDEHWQTLTRALACQPLTREGATLQPPAPDLLNRLWQARTDGASVARDRSGLIIARTRADADSEQQIATRYHEAWQASWNGAAAPRVTLVRAAVPGSDVHAVRAAIEPDIRRYVERMARVAGRTPAALERADDTAKWLDALGVAHGTPQDIFDALSADAALPLATQLVVQVQTESTTLDQAIARLESFAHDVWPALRAARANTPFPISNKESA